MEKVLCLFNFRNVFGCVGLWLLKWAYTCYFFIFANLNSSTLYNYITMVTNEHSVQVMAMLFALFPISRLFRPSCV